MLENLPGPTTFIPPDVMELIKSVKLDISSIPAHLAHLAPKNAMEDFDRFIAEFYPCVGLREELQKRLNAANVGKVHVSWNEDWLRRVDGTLDPVEKENEIRKAVSNFLGIMNDVEKDYEVIDLGPTSRIDVIDLDPTRRMEDFGPTPEHRKGKGSLVETLPYVSELEITMMLETMASSRYKQQKYQNIIKQIYNLYHKDQSIKKE